MPTGFFELLLGRTSVEIPLPEGLGAGAAPQVILCDGRLRVEAGGNLAVQGQANIAFASFPYLGTLLPDETTPLSAAVRYDNATGLTVEVAPGSRLELGIDLPTLDAGGNGQIALGRISGRISRVGLQLPKDQQPVLKVVLSLTLPAGLNQILGGHEIFETSKPISATVSVGPGASVTLGDALGEAPSQVTSPLKAIAQPLTWDGTDVKGRLDLGGAGALQIRVPKLAFGEGVFAAHGGFELDPDRPLGVPLWPLKSALGHLIGAAVDGLPDYLPLQDISALDENDELTVGKLVKALNTLIPQGAGPESWLRQAIAELQAALAPIERFAQHLPERLKQYLRASPFHPGQKFDLDITVSPAGSLDVRIECKPALRLLVPTPSTLIGIELGEFSLGLILGGALLKLKVDACIDTFDLVSLGLLLAAAVAGDEAERLKPWLPDLSRMQNTLVASELLALIEYESVVPIPIPLLAKDLGFKFVGIGGLEMAAGVSCHLQRDGILDILETARELFRFITTDAPLSQDDAQGLQLMVGVGPTYLQLPQLIGGQVVGSKSAPLVPEENAVGYAFRLLNALKGFSLAELVRGVPLARRVQAFEVALGPATASGGVAVTTADEFQDGFARSDVAPHDQLYALSQDRAAAERLLAPIRAATAPAAGATQRSGVVALAAGACSFGGVLSLQAQSAAALIGASAFAGVFRLDGAIAGLSLDLSGSAHFDLQHLREQGAIGVAGSAVLKLKEDVVCRGDITISGAGIAFGGDFDAGTALVPTLADVLHVTGKFNATLSKTGFRLGLDATGNAHVKLLGVSGAAQHFELTSRGLTARLTAQLTARSANVSSCDLTLGIPDFQQPETYSITGSVKGQFTADAALQALSALKNAYRNALNNAHAALDRKIAHTPYSQPINLAELEAERAVIQALQAGETWSRAIETAIASVIGAYATTVTGIAKWLTPAGVARTVAARLGVFGGLAQCSPAQWAACVTVTELRLTATVGRPAVVFDVYGSWWASGTKAPQKLAAVRADMQVLDPYAIMKQLVAGIVQKVVPTGRGS
jgi:hypothetical protein